MREMRDTICANTRRLRCRTLFCINGMNSALLKFTLSVTEVLSSLCLKHHQNNFRTIIKAKWYDTVSKATADHHVCTVVGI